MKFLVPPESHRTGLGAGFFCGCGSGYGIGLGFGLGFPIAKWYGCTISIGTGVGCGIGFGAGLGFGLYWNSIASMEQLEKKAKSCKSTILELWKRYF
ncbi:hypothetical protein GAYE_SCF55G6302 [Galdieria yellowstonensis]|uniref:Uncharacterized protein n=1 Tax=Galdieria yellowstonensis TaxID=3028027 RepID=A0AAV9IMI9_9RHOD|nr:hypothetical protein GAYE_SCF55G6302 [Galdieria yellowstonensis]